MRTEPDRHLPGQSQFLRALHPHAADLRADEAFAHGQAEVAPFVVHRGLEREVPFACEGEDGVRVGSVTRDACPYQCCVLVGIDR